MHKKCITQHRGETPNTIDGTLKVKRKAPRANYPRLPDERTSTHPSRSFYKRINTVSLKRERERETQIEMGQKEIFF